MKRYFSTLGEPVNNSQLIAFRVLFGLVMAGQCVYSLACGLVKLLYVDIAHNFTFIGFEWLKVMHGPGMYGYFALMALCGLLVAAGMLFRYSSVLLALMWTAYYLSHKTLYNNHYYLMVLLCWMMACMPAANRFSADVKLKLATPRNHCYRWQIHLFIFQIACVYVFAAIAKMNYDWLHGLPLKITLPHHRGLPVIGRVMGSPLLPWIVCYGGLLFDLLAVPGLLYKRTRPYFFVLYVLFHMFNGYVFKIGSFPYLATSLAVFFFPPETFNKVIPLLRQGGRLRTWTSLKSHRVIAYLLTIYVVLQLFLPLRHWLIPGNVAWTDEGGRMAWRMMLRSKTGTVKFKIVDQETDSTWYVLPSSFVNYYQENEVAVLPDVTWQSAQYLKERYERQGIDVAVYAITEVSLNFGKPKSLIDTTTDLAHTAWNTWGHSKWIITGK